MSDKPVTYDPQQHEWSDDLVSKGKELMGRLDRLRQERDELNNSLADNGQAMDGLVQALKELGLWLLSDPGDLWDET